VSDLVAARFPDLPHSKETADRTSISIDQLSPQAEASDEVLLTRIARRDQQALGYLFQRYIRLVRCLAARILKDAAEAEDLVQDLFLFIQRKCGIFDSSKGSARSWIVQMTYQRAISRRRYLAARRFYVSEEFQDAAEGVVGIATVENDYSPEAVFGRNGLTKLLATLSEDQRETLRLHFFEGYTFAEIAEKLGQPLGNVRHHYYRGLDKLRKQMLGSSVRVAERHGRQG
jgi:RNA polymerase sigma-70 factor (ECF subfamily)